MSKINYKQKFEAVLKDNDQHEAELNTLRVQISYYKADISEQKRICKLAEDRANKYWTKYCDTDQMLWYANRTIRNYKFRKAGEIALMGFVGGLTVFGFGGMVYGLGMGVFETKKEVNNGPSVSNVNSSAVAGEAVQSTGPDVRQEDRNLEYQIRYWEWVGYPDQAALNRLP